MYTNAIWVVGFRHYLLRIYSVNNPAFFLAGGTLRNP